MALKNPKEKGNSHERNVANMLTEWSGHKFLRTPSSGAIHNFHDRRVVSDIVAPESLRDFPFSIECKNTEVSWEFNTIIEGTAAMWKQWEQCTTDADREEMIPMLVFTKNYRPIYVAIQQEIFDKLKIEPVSYLRVVGQENLVIIDFKEFLSLITVEELIKRLI